MYLGSGTEEQATHTGAVEGGEQQRRWTGRARRKALERWLHSSAPFTFGQEASLPRPLACLPVPINGLFIGLSLPKFQVRVIKNKSKPQ